MVNSLEKAHHRKTWAMLESVIWPPGNDLRPVIARYGRRTGALVDIDWPRTKLQGAGARDRGESPPGWGSAGGRRRAVSFYHFFAGTRGHTPCISTTACCELPWAAVATAFEENGGAGGEMSLWGGRHYGVSVAGIRRRGKRQINLVQRGGARRAGEDSCAMLKAEKGRGGVAERIRGARAALFAAGRPCCGLPTPGAGEGLDEAKEVIAADQVLRYARARPGGGGGGGGGDSRRG